MSLINANKVCELLDVSKSTLYRWCNLSELSDDISPKINPLDVLKNKELAGCRDSFTSTLREALSNTDVPSGFPRPFKIGKSLKWDEDEIRNWLKNCRI